MLSLHFFKSIKIIIMLALLFVAGVMVLAFLFNFIITSSTYKQNERLNNKINKDTPNVFFDPIFESVKVGEPIVESDVEVVETTIKPKRKYTKRVK